MWRGVSGDAVNRGAGVEEPWDVSPGMLAAFGYVAK